MITSLLEQRRLQAREFDEQQRQAEERAAQVPLVSSPKPCVPTTLPAPITGEDRLSSMLLGDTQRLATLADVLVMFQHFEEAIDELRAEFETTAEIE